MAKRLFDITCAAIGLVVSAPVLIALLAAIRWGSRGAPVFAQRRIGRDGREFTCYKLRTMHTGTANLPSHMLGASALTPIGGYLRRWKLDEVPQLYNVLRGEMSLVGPRPCLISQTQLIEARRELGVLGVRPGITGLAQVRGVDMSDARRLALVDSEYVRNRSFAVDLRLILATVFGEGVGVDRVVT